MTETEDEVKSDAEIIGNLITQMDSLETTRAKIILKAANKLADSGKYEDTTIISSRLKRIWTTISKSTIDKALPDMYKRKYEQKADIGDAPRSLVQEVLARIDDLDATFRQQTTQLLRHCKADDDVDKTLTDQLPKTFKEINSDKFWNLVRDQSRIITDIDGLIEYIKVMQANADWILQATDYRIKLDAFIRLRLRMMSVYETVGSLARIFHISSKWAHAAKEDATVDETLKALRNCPECKCNLSDIFNTTHEFIKSNGRKPKQPK